MNTNDPQGDAKHEARLLQRSREVFDDSVDNLDANTRSRLNQARHAALQAAQPSTSSSFSRWLMPAGGMAALALIGVMSVHLWQARSSGSHSDIDAAASVDVIEIAMADADLDMLNDMDFYATLEEDDLRSSPQAAHVSGAG